MEIEEDLFARLHYPPLEKTDVCGSLATSPAAALRQDGACQLFFRGHTRGSSPERVGALCGAKSLKFTFLLGVPWKHVSQQFIT